MKTIIALVAVAALAGAYFMMSSNPSPQPSDSNIEQQFLFWMTQHDKTYDSVMEYNMRLGIFADAISKIDAHS